MAHHGHGPKLPYFACVHHLNGDPGDPGLYFTMPAADVQPDPITDKLAGYLPELVELPTRIVIDGIKQPDPRFCAYVQRAYKGIVDYLYDSLEDDDTYLSYLVNKIENLLATYADNGMSINADIDEAGRSIVDYVAYITKGPDDPTFVYRYVVCRVRNADPAHPSRCAPRRSALAIMTKCARSTWATIPHHIVLAAHLTLTQNQLIRA